MNALRTTVYFIASAFLSVGVYIVYNQIQKLTLSRARELSTYVDDHIPFKAGWVWIYSGVYYIFFCILLFLCPDPLWFVKIIFGFVIMATLHMIVYVTLPIKTPAHWRDFGDEKSLAVRFLIAIQKTDETNNALPSTHVGAAMMIALHLAEILQNEDPIWGIAAFAFPALIAVSASMTKQHYVIDYPPAIALAWLSYSLAAMIIGA